MREILFRGWTIGEFRWEYGFLSWLDTPRGRGYFINNKRIGERTLGQFTGMIDKNGTKIFEGDILNEPFQGGEKLKIEKITPANIPNFRKSLEGEDDNYEE